MVHASGRVSRNARSDRARAARRSRARRRRWYRKSKTSRALTLASKAYTLAKRLMPEMKYQQYNNGSFANDQQAWYPLVAHTYGNSGVSSGMFHSFYSLRGRAAALATDLRTAYTNVYSMSRDLMLVSQGLTDSNRVGDSIHSKGIWMDLHFLVTDSTQLSLNQTRVPVANQTDIHCFLVKHPGPTQSGGFMLDHNGAVVLPTADAQENMMAFLYSMCEEPLTQAFVCDPRWRKPVYRKGGNSKSPDITSKLPDLPTAIGDYITDGSPPTGALISDTPSDAVLQTRPNPFQVVWHESFTMGTPQNASEAPVTDVHIKKMVKTDHEVRYEDNGFYDGRVSYHLFILHNGTSISTASTLGDANRVWIQSEITHFFTDD